MDKGLRRVVRLSNLTFLSLSLLRTILQSASILQVLDLSGSPVTDRIFKAEECSKREGMRARGMALLSPMPQRDSKLRRGLVVREHRREREVKFSFYGSISCVDAFFSMLRNLEIPFYFTPILVVSQKEKFDTWARACAGSCACERCGRYGR
jgi:hypothetical protein